MLKVALDTNVIVSSVISRKGAPFQLIQAWHAGKFTLISSPQIIEEVVGVLSQPRIKGTFFVTDGRITQLAETLRVEALLVDGKADVHGAIPNDPSDEMFLAAALDGQADVIVSGDKHLLGLGSFRSIPILTPRQFLDQLEPAQ